MKRFHVHVAVDDLAASIVFYNKLFGQSPSKQQPDYAKWMLEDPRLNFAISARGHAAGVNHFGMQAESAEELADLKALAGDASGGATLDQGETACCYAKSEKHWTIDPQGMAWEHFLTMSDALAFGSDTATQSGACCIPLRTSEEASTSAACCVPNDAQQGKAQCCG
ncbi:MAG TPA: ArsI/CadI family heavy metal resistance metalloenzyme [Candidatus Contendobacter sp.]|nr:ArsI/CadI family heavy metal resistance metalloenzyme [Candidatus Contendobacter sp.]HRD50322.1 ArsI/CadI family heavy metal resistance metalloenzyme [Candidatus Contendobacter sp.]